MRSDMAKILVERPRPGSRYGRMSRRLARRRQASCNFDQLPAKHGMRRGYDWSDRKELNENLKPLQRFLVSRVGHKWDKVYAEIRARIDPANAVQQHIMTHLYDFVDKARVTPDGQVEFISQWGTIRRSRYSWREEFYIDPQDGLLKRKITEKDRKRWAQQRKQEQAEEKARRIVLDTMTEFRRIDGIWYRVEYAPLSPRAARTSAGANGTVVTEWHQPKAYDVLKKALVTEGSRYAAHKRHLTKKELRTYRLKNTPV